MDWTRFTPKGCDLRKSREFTSLKVRIPVMSDMLTLLIPTLNRSEFLIRLLHYYRDLKFRGTICIGDASDACHAERNKAIVNSMDGILNIRYLEQSDPKYSLCFQQLSEAVLTPYTAYVSDDNFLVPGSVEQCVEFLENHEDYSAAHGLAVMFSLESSGPYGNVRWIGPYPHRPVEAETASQRLMDYVSAPFMPLFSVHRTEVWQRICRDVTLPMEWFFADEGLPSWLSVIEGKIKKLDCLYLAFQHHEQRTRHPDLFDCITNPAWASSYHIFRDCVAEELVRQDGISMEEAQELVKRGCWLVLGHALTKKWEGRYGQKNAENGSSPLREAARRVPGLKRAWRTVRSVISDNKAEISLEALLSPSSPYHADFMQIYRAVSNPPADLQESADLIKRLSTTVASRSSITGA